jgi:nucleotide-binding universal stress UspA family protein
MSTSSGLEKIILATDGSKYAEAAVDATIKLARGSRAEVRVLNVWNLDIRQRHCAWDVEVRCEARQLLEATVERLTKAGVHAEGAILRADGDHVAAAVLATARTFNADLVVIGSRGLSDWQSMLDQRVSHQLLSGADCPLLMVRGRTPTAGRASRVLLALAGGDDIGRTARMAIAVAPAPDCLVLVVHAGQLLQEPQGTLHSTDDETRAPIAKALTLLDEAGISARGVATQPGRVADVIARIANTWDVDVIVTGSSRMGDLASMVLGSVSHELLHAAGRPVLTAGLALS